MSAVVFQASTTRKTAAEAVAVRALVIQVGDQRHDFRAEFIAGRQGTLVISDEFASGQHARFRISRGGWYVDDLRSTNGTWLNGRRIHTAQWLKEGRQDRDRARCDNRAVGVSEIPAATSGLPALRSPPRGGRAVQPHP